jgi:hypothetical protein
LLPTWDELAVEELAKFETITTSLLHVERVRCKEELLFEWRLTHPEHRGINRMIEGAAHI